MAGYTKLFSSIVASTIWREDNDTRIVWITMLALADRNGVVEASVPGLADLSRVSVDACRRALVKLSSPDPDSRSQEHDGRRVESFDGGWRILNHARYRDKLSQEERREYKRIKQAEYRQRDRMVDSRGPELTEIPREDKGDTVQSTEYRVQSTEEEGEDESSFAPAILMTIWNEETTAPTPKCMALSKGRKAKAAVRLVEHGPDWWREVIRRINASDFCRGHNDRAWVATFDWLIANQENAIKVLEGKYDNRVPVFGDHVRHREGPSAETLANEVRQKLARGGVSGRHK